MTLLVNVWRDGAPAGVAPLPESMAAALSAGPNGRLLRRACGRAAPPPAPRVIDVSQIPADAQHTVELEDHVDGRTAPLPKAALLSAASEPGDPSFVVVI